MAMYMAADTAHVTKAKTTGFRKTLAVLQSRLLSTGYSGGYRCRTSLGSLLLPPPPPPVSLLSLCCFTVVCCAFALLLSLVAAFFERWRVEAAGMVEELWKWLDLLTRYVWSTQHHQPTMPFLDGSVIVSARKGSAASQRALVTQCHKRIIALPVCVA